MRQSCHFRLHDLTRRHMAERPEIPIYAISLADSDARRATLLSAMTKIGLPFEFVNAIDGRAGLPPCYSDSYDKAATRRRLGRDLSTAEIAASLSHGLVYTRILEEGHDHALIFEDDAEPGPLLPKFLSSGCYRSAPIVLLHHLNARVMPGKRTPGGDGIALRELAVPCFRAAAYTVSREAAKALRDASMPVTTPPDWPCDITRIGAFVTEPQIVGHPPQDTGQSILSASGRTRDRAPLSRIFHLSYLRRKWRKARSERIS